MHRLEELRRHVAKLTTGSRASDVIAKAIIRGEPVDASSVNDRVGLEALAGLRTWLETVIEMGCAIPNFGIDEDVARSALTAWPAEWSQHAAASSKAIVRTVLDALGSIATGSEGREIL